MDTLRQVADDEMFEERLKENLSLTPEEKRKRLSQVDKKANGPSRAVIGAGQRFDVLEFETDLPMMPQYGNVLPSQRGLRKAVGCRL